MFTRSSGGMGPAIWRTQLCMGALGACLPICSRQSFLNAGCCLCQSNRNTSSSFALVTGAAKAVADRARARSRAGRVFMVFPDKLNVQAAFERLFIRTAPLILFGIRQIRVACCLPTQDRFRCRFLVGTTGVSVRVLRRFRHGG